MSTANPGVSTTLPARIPFRGIGWPRFVGLLLLVATALFARSMSRFFDLDEHQFVAPALLLTEQGMEPYEDYPYFHMPLLVYFYAFILKWVPFKLLTTRTVSVCCGFLTALLLFETGWRALRNLSNRTRWLLAGGITLTFLCSRLFTYTYPWSWNHNTAVLACLSASLLYLRALRQARMWQFAVSGALLGAAIGLRLSFAFAFLPFALSLFTARSPLTPRQRLRALALAAGAALLVLLPAFRLWARSPEQFVFGNVGYPHYSTQMYISVDQIRNISLPGKCLYLIRVFVTDPGNLVLFVWTAFALGVQFVKRRQWRSEYANELWLLVGLLPVLLIGAFGPSPVFPQYLYMLLPFMTLLVLYSIAADQNLQHIVNRWKRIVSIGLLLAAGTGLPRWYHYISNAPFPDRWTPVLVHDVGTWIRQNVPEGGRVLTIDPVFAQEGGLEVYPEFGVGRFIMLVGHLMTPEDRARYDMAWGEHLDRVVEQNPPAAVFLHRRTYDLSGPLRQYAETHGFKKIEAPNGAFQLWVRPERTDQGTAPPAATRIALADNFPDS